MNVNPLNLSKLPDTILLSSQGDSKGVIYLKTKDGTIVALTPQKLQTWLAIIETGLHGGKYNPLYDELNANLLLSRYGIKSANDLMRFLRSPAGKIALTLVEHKLAVMLSLHHHKQEEMLFAIRKHFLKLAFMLLGLAHKKALRIKMRNELMQQQMEELRKKAAAAEREILVIDMYNLLQRQYESLIASLIALEYLLNEKTAELEAARLALRENWEILESHHAILLTILEELDVLAEKLALEDPMYVHALTTSRIAELENELSEYTQKLSTLDEHTASKDIRTLLHLNHALRLHIEGIRAIQTIHLGRNFFTAEGELTDSYHKAAFMLTPDLKIVKENGVFYLIGATQNLSALSETEKAEAKHNFDTTKPEICTIKNQVMEKYQRDTSHLQTMQQQIQVREQEITLLTDQISQLKISQSQVLGEMNKYKPSPAPKVQNVPNFVPQNTLPNSMQRPTIPNTIPVPTNTPLPQPISQALVAMQRNPNQQNINQLRNQLNLFFGPNMNANLREDLNKIIPGKSISVALMASLNRNIYRQFSMATDALDLSPAANKKLPPTPTPFRK